jgi:ABC-type uncharacterized transport system substrate-binding protein
MRRREFIALLIGTTAWPLIAYAQQPEQLRRIGVFINLASNDPEMLLRLAALRKGLQALGWMEGRNLQIEIRPYSGDVDQIRTAAAELVGLKPDVIFVYGPPGLSALRRETQTVPIVFVQVSNPIGAGFVANMARPGGNITGFTSSEILAGGKWLEVLKEIAPGVVRCAIILNPDNPGQGGFLGAIEAAATALKVQTTPIAMRDTSERERMAMENAVEAFARQPNGGILVLPDFTTISLRQQMVALAAKHRLPAIYPFRYFAVAGGLVSYGVDQIEQTRQAAPYLDRILKGEKPGDLPVQAPTKFELVINLKTAKALGLTVPSSLLAAAIEVIE